MSQKEMNSFPFLSNRLFGRLPKLRSFIHKPISASYNGVHHNDGAKELQHLLRPDGIVERLAKHWP